MRWADMDLLGHVNNVTYLDYVAEARENLFAGHPVGTAPVSRHQVEFAKPLVFRRGPVLVDTWVTDIDDDAVTVAHEVYDDPADGESQRDVYVRAVSVLDHRLSEAERALAEQTRGPEIEWRPVSAEVRPRADMFPLTVRRSDVGEGGLVRSGVFFEYAQEARIRFLMNLHTRGEQWSAHVIARTDIDYLSPLAYRQEPYAVHSWVSHLGSRSFTISSEVRDADRVVARAVVVLVCFDLETQTTTGMSEQQRARLERELRS